MTNANSANIKNGIMFPQDLLDKIVKSLDITDLRDIQFIVNNNSIIITKSNNQYKTIEELFEGFDGEVDDEFIDFGPPVGREIC